MMRFVALLSRRTGRVVVKHKVFYDAFFCCGPRHELPHQANPDSRRRSGKKINKKDQNAPPEISTSSVLALILLGATAAIGAGHDIRHAKGNFEAVAPEYAGATGHVILNYARGKDSTIVQVNVRGLQPNTSYEFNLTHGLPSVWLTTRRNGSANLHYELDGNHAGHLPAMIWAADDTLILVAE